MCYILGGILCSGRVSEENLHKLSTVNDNKTNGRIDPRLEYKVEKKKQRI